MLQDLDLHTPFPVEDIHRTVVTSTHHCFEVFAERDMFWRPMSWRACREVPLPPPRVQLVQIESIDDTVNDKLVPRW